MSERLRPALAFVMLVGSPLAVVEAQSVGPGTGITAATSTAGFNRASLSADVDLREVQIDGRRLVYQDTGGEDLPVIVCLHAIGHGSGDYAALVAALRDRYRIIALDWPGHGRSEQSDLAPGTASYAALLARFTEQLGLTRYAVVGNSVGGGAALAHAVDHAPKVSAVIVSNPAGLDEGGLMGRLFTWWMSRRFERARTDPSAFQSWFARYVEAVLPREPAALQRSRIVASGQEIAPLLAVAWRGFSRPENDIRAAMPGLRVPVLVAWAQRDDVVRWSRNRVAIETIPRRQIVFFDAGHTPVLETPNEYLAAVQPFLESNR